MKVEYDINSKKHEIYASTFDTIKELITRLDAAEISFLILEGNSRNYLQCAGNKGKFVLEGRFYIDYSSFRHYVIGNNSPAKIHCIVNTQVGPIHVLENEVLDITTVTNNLEHFFRTGELISEYNKRNITKKFRNV